MFQRSCPTLWLWLLTLVRLKSSEPVPLTAGVLIIGSLLWDSGKGRPAWRDARLDVASAQAVTAPIRYGRKARTRGNSFTMGFSRQCPAGMGKPISLYSTISNP